jgi:hypothetical protein
LLRGELETRMNVGVRGGRLRFAPLFAEIAKWYFIFVAIDVKFVHSIGDTPTDGYPDLTFTGVKNSLHFHGCERCAQYSASTDLPNPFGGCFL